MRQLGVWGSRVCRQTQSDMSDRYLPKVSKMFRKGILLLFSVTFAFTSFSADSATLSGIVVGSNRDS